MSISSWEPNAPVTSMSFDALIELSALGAPATVFNNVKSLTPEQLSTLQNAYAQEESFWKDIADEISNETLEALIFLLTALEEERTEFFKADKSPVIAINKLLKKRGSKLSKETLLWIRQHSSNRYLPNGRVL